MSGRDYIQPIHDADVELTTAKQQKNRAKKAINNHVKNMPEWIDVVEAKESLKQAQSKLTQALLRDGKYDELLQKYEDYAKQVRDADEVLESLLLSYYEQTSEHVVPQTEKTERPIYLSASLGKEVEKQENLFDDPTTPDEEPQE